MNKNILIALGLIVVLALAGGGYYLWSNSAVDSQEPVVEVEDHEYHSAQYGLSFSYPDTYGMTEHDEGTAERITHAVVLMDKDFQIVPESEGPPVIAVTIFENPENLSLSKWITDTSYSNYKLATDPTLTPTFVGGQIAFLYSHSGLYETDAVVTMYNGRVYMFTTGWIAATDQIRTDFQKVLDTVEFVAS